jgi:two-component system cell cycle sensor histidine kinase/response regulator CckA
MKSFYFLKNKGFFFKIGLMVLSLLIISIGLITVVSIKEQTKTVKTELLEKNKIISAHLASSAKNAFWSLNWLFVEKQMQESTRSEDVLFLEIAKPNGEVYLAFGDKECGENVLTPELMSPERQIVKDVICSKMGETAKLIITPIEIGNEIWSLIMVLSLKQIEEAKEAILKDNALWGSIIFLLGLLVSFWFSRRMTKPIKQLVKGTEEIAKGNLVHRIKVGSLDEIGNLSNSFNRMIEDLQKTTTSRDQLAKEVIERKQVEEALKESEEKYRQLVNYAPSGILELDIAANKLITVNDVACEYTGYTKEELFSMNLFDLLTEDSKRLFKERVSKMSGGEEISESIEYKIKRKDGKELVCIVNSRITFDEDGRPIKSTIVVNDITDLRQSEEEKKKLEAQFIQAQKMEAIGRLAGGVAHDFNNLMTSVIGNADLALMNLREENPLREYLKEIEKAGDRAASLTRQLLAFSRKQIFKPEVLDLNNGIREIEKMLGRMIEDDIELKTAPGPSLCRVEVDPTHIDQVIMNLAINARDAMPQGGKLTIETTNVELDKACFRTHGVEEQPGPYVMLAVSDTGIGMDEETQSHIFEPFFTTKKRGKGTGLGLSTVYGIVKQSGGFIWVYSEPGQGTTFKVYLPRVEGDAESVKKERAPMEDLSGSETVLIVEDDDALRDLAQRILQLYGYRVLEAKQGEDALRVTDEHEGPIQLMVTDVVMPGMSGRELAERLKPLYPDMKILYMSGYTDNSIVHHGVLAKGLNFIQKPFTPEGLASKVREILDQ